MMAACGWGRWGQQLAIVRYPYLKPTGKGAFHKQAIRSYKDLLPGLLLLCEFEWFTLAIRWQTPIFGFGNDICWQVRSPLCTGAWFNHKLGGHTGDTYGAVVEWTEALFLCVLTTLGS